MKSSHCKSPFLPIWRIARERCLPALAMALMLTMIAGPALAAEGDTSSDISAATAEQVMAQLLQSRGLTAPAASGLTLDDYIDSNAGKNGARRVWVSLGPDGHIIPKPAWQHQHAEYCKQRARYMLPVAQRLRFKLRRNTQTYDGKTRYQYDVFLGLVDHATGAIKEQNESKSSIMHDSNAKSGFRENPDADGLAAPMGDALDRLKVKVGAPVDACGEIRLQHISGSQVKKPVTFRAGFQGSYGRYLNYTWSFGDGSAAEDIGKNASHIYAKKGTYTVTVRVAGKNVKPGSKSISVVIGEIQPRDGTWSIKLTSHEMLGCSPRIAKAAKSGLTKMVGENHEQELTFAKPFHPEPLMQNNPKPLHWEHTGSNQWQTEISKQGSKAMSMRMVLGIEVMSETRINEVGTYHLDVSPMFVKMMGGSAHCRSIGHYEMTWLHY